MKVNGSSQSGFQRRRFGGMRLIVVLRERCPVMSHKHYYAAGFNEPRLGKVGNGKPYAHRENLPAFAKSRLRYAEPSTEGRLVERPARLAAHGEVRAVANLDRNRRAGRTRFCRVARREEQRHRTTAASFLATSFRPTSRFVPGLDWMDCLPNCHDGP